MGPRYVGPHDEVRVRLPDDTHEVVKRGEHLQSKVPAGFARQLIEQGWAAGKSQSSKPKKRAPKKRAAVQPSTTASQGGEE